MSTKAPKRKSLQQKAKNLTARLHRDPVEVEDERLNIRRQIASTGRLNGGYLVMNVLATFVAAYGLLSGSTAVVIGAMVIAQLLGPINGIALSLVDGDFGLLKRSLIAEAIGVAAVLGTALLVGNLHFGMPMTSEMIARTQPGLLDLLIAIFGGAAGAYAAASPKISAGLVGVAIATALVPPLTTGGILLAWGETRLAGGALLLFLINLVAIQFATSAVLWGLGYHKLLARPESLKSFFTRNAPSSVLIVVLGVAMFISFKGTIARVRAESAVREALEGSLKRRPAAQLADFQIWNETDRRVVVATVRTPFSFTPEQVKEIERELPQADSKRNELHIRSILIKEADSHRYLHQPPSDATASDETGSRPPRLPSTLEITGFDSP